MLVANALDVVLAVSVAQHGRTFECFRRDDPGAMARFEIVAGSDGSG